MSQSFSPQQLSDMFRAINQSASDIVSGLSGSGADTLDARIDDATRPPLRPAQETRSIEEGGLEGPRGFRGYPGVEGLPGLPGDPGSGETGAAGRDADSADVRRLADTVQRLIDLLNQILQGGYVIDVVYDPGSRTFSKTRMGIGSSAAGGRVMEVAMEEVFVAVTDCD